MDNNYHSNYYGNSHYNAPYTQPYYPPYYPQYQQNHTIPPYNGEHEYVLRSEFNNFRTQMLTIVNSQKVIIDDMASKINNLTDEMMYLRYLEEILLDSKHTSHHKKKSPLSVFTEKEKEKTSFDDCIICSEHKCECMSDESDSDDDTDGDKKKNSLEIPEIIITAHEIDKSKDKLDKDVKVKNVQTNSKSDATQKSKSSKSFKSEDTNKHKDSDDGITNIFIAGPPMMFNPLNQLFGALSHKMKDDKVKGKDDKNSDDDTDTPEEVITVFEEDKTKKTEDLGIEIKTIDDLIELGKLYPELKKKQEEREKSKPPKIPIVDKKIEVPVKTTNLYEFDGKYYSVNLETIYKLSPPLKKLSSMIGLTKIKDAVLDMILYYLQNFENKNNNMLHTVIEGPPGVGKTDIGRLIGKIYRAMDIIPSNKFKCVKRTDLVGQYLGHTAQKTQKAIDEADGGILFIDEAYSLGSQDGGDSFSKECIDTLNQNLSENKKKFICIIAGYPDELEKSFFSYNPGLRRRFPFRYRIDGYDPKEMTKIFMKKLQDTKWTLDTSIKEDKVYEFFDKNENKFPNFGGDIDNLLIACKFCHSRRVVSQHPKLRRIFTMEDIENGFSKYQLNKTQKFSVVNKDSHNAIYA